MSDNINIRSLIKKGRQLGGSWHEEGLEEGLVEHVYYLKDLLFCAVHKVTHKVEFGSIKHHIEIERHTTEEAK